MQFIQELTLLQQARAGAIAVLVLVLVLAALKRRRTAPPGAEAERAKPPKEKRVRGRRANRTPVPRRRRKLAAEAAMSIGIETPPAHEEAAVSDDIVVPPVPKTEEPTPAPAPVAVAEPAPAPRAVVVDDPYMGDLAAFSSSQSTVVEEPEAMPDRVVADPGWPAPGELSASFDPDAFDPLPEVEEPAGYADQPTEAIELPSIADDDFDPATGWSDNSAPTPVAAAGGDLDHLWGESEDETAQWETASATAPVADSSEVEMALAAEESWNDETVTEVEESWDDPTTDAWSSPEPEDELVIGSDTPTDNRAWGDASLDPADLVAELADRTDVDAASVPVDEIPAFDVEAFDPSELTVQTPSFPEPMYRLHDAQRTDQTEPTIAGISLGGSGNAGPVVLDIAALAAAGHPVELLIEPTADGSGGVRLRIGAVSDAAAANARTLVETPDVAAVAEDAQDPTYEHTSGLPKNDTPEDEAAVSFVWDTVQTEVEEPQDIPFLTGGPVTAEEPAAPSAISEATEDVHAAVYDVYLDQQPVGTPPAVFATVSDAPDEDSSDPEDDPARILADIRTRLAALDTQRDTHAL